MYKQSFFLSISKGLKSLSSLIITMIVARVLTKNDYGVYRQYILISSFLGGILSLGIPTAVSYLYKTINKDEQSKLFTSTTINLGIISFLTFVILILFKGSFISILSKSGEIGDYFYLLILYIVVLVLFSFLENLYTSDNKGHTFAKINIFYFIIQIILFIYISLVYKNLFFILLMFFLLEMLKGFFLYFLYKKQNSIKYELNKSILKRQIIIASPVGMSYIAQSLNQYLGNLFVSNRYSVEDFAIYSVGVTEIPLISIITISIATAILPVLSEKYNKEHNKYEMLEIWKESTFVGSIFIFPVFWILFYFGNGYIEFIFSKDYLNAKDIYLIFLCKLPLAVTIFGNILIVLNKSKYIIFNMIFGFIINIFLILLLSKFLNLEGVALASVLTQFILVLITLQQITKVIEVPLKKILPYKKLAEVFGISGLVTLVAYLISLLFTMNNILELFLFGIMALLAITTIFYRMGFLNKFKQQITKRISGEK